MNNVKKEKLADSCGKYLAELMNSDSRIIVLDGDLADSNGAIHVHQKQPDRFIMCGISEQCMVSVAAGMAVEGNKPWVFSFASFLCYRAYDQIRISVAQCNTNVKLVGSHAGGFTGRNGKTHSALNDIAIISSLPNMKIYSPSTPEETNWAVEAMNNEDNPSYLRLPREQMASHDKIAKSWRWMSDNEGPIAILATGLSVPIAIRLQKYCLEELNLEIGLINVVEIHPLPESLITELNEKLNHVIVLEDHLVTHGMASLLRNYNLNCKIEAFGWDPSYMADSGDFEEILENSSLNPKSITTKLKEILC